MTRSRSCTEVSRKTICLVGEINSLIDFINVSCLVSVQWYFRFTVLLYFRFCLFNYIDQDGLYFNDIQ